MLNSGFHRRMSYLPSVFFCLSLFLAADPVSGSQDILPSIPVRIIKHRKQPLNPSLRQELLRQAGPFRFLCVLTQQADVQPSRLLSSKKEKTRYVFHALRLAAQSAQEPVRERLAAGGCSIVNSYTVLNALLVQCRSRTETVKALEQIEKDESIARIEPDLPFAMPSLESAPSVPRSIQSSAEMLWNLQIIGTAEVWAKGFRGKDVVIGNQDTGIQWDHPALMRQYRGWSEATVRHDHHWWDAVHQAIGLETNPCGYSSISPCDDRGHGTHTMGISLGDDEGLQHIGVAPEAKWIGCRNMDLGIGRPSTYLECFDFFLAPWDLQKQNPDPDLSPDIINNSWSCPVSEGCATESLFMAVRHIRAAGMILSVSAGNSGADGCGSINEEPAIFDEVTTIGSTDSMDEISYSSSRGPVLADQSGRVKPDLAAPGVSVYSTWKDSTYRLASGTSMAAPHFSGAVAVLLSAYPELKGNVDAIETLFFQGAVRRRSLLSCGEIPYDQVPNAVYGWGRIHLPNTIRLAGYRMKAFLPPIQHP